METILDANVLFRTLISGGNIIDLMFDDSLTIYAPERLREEFISHKQEIIEKSNLSKIEVEELTSLIFERIIFISIDEYTQFLLKAKQILGKHEKDEDFIALCMLRNCKLWTYEKLLFDIDFGISTKEIAEELSKGSSSDIVKDEGY